MWIDISARLSRVIPVWPKSRGYEIRRETDISQGDEVTVSTIEMDVHCGTHIDAPAHFVPGGASIGDVDFESLIGTAYVVEIPRTREISAEHLESRVPVDAQRLLLKTDNGELWSSSTFSPDFAALTSDASLWIADRGLRLIGNDYLSVQLFDGDPETHRILMRQNVVILEGLDLRLVSQGWYEFVCLPLRLEDAEAAPARALVRSIEARDE